MTGEHHHVYEAWRGTLTREEQAEVDYMMTLDGGSHANAYIAVRLMRLEQRSIWKDGVKAVGAVSGIAAAIVGTVVAAYKGSQ